jgi:hypothetical protein
MECNTADVFFRLQKDYTRSKGQGNSRIEQSYSIEQVGGELKIGSKAFSLGVDQMSK